MGLPGQVLMKMPVRADTIKSSGIAGTISDRVASHPNRILREAAANNMAALKIELLRRARKYAAPK